MVGFFKIYIILTNVVVKIFKANSGRACKVMPLRDVTV